ncbi:hypothetical protein BTVI_30265 [Pitangus sulphuratus]|nr:hypothetical protein BTVI_30265 [Pitangus sulphuratus]
MLMGGSYCVQALADGGTTAQGTGGTEEDNCSISWEAKERSKARIWFQDRGIPVCPTMLDIKVEDGMALIMARNSTFYRVISLLPNLPLLSITTEHHKNTWSGPRSPVPPLHPLGHPPSVWKGE